MRKAQMVPGLNNKQVIRFICNGFPMYTTVQGIHNIGSTKYRVAVWQTVEKLALDRAMAKQRQTDMPSGLGWTVSVRNERSELEDIQVQVDICQNETVIW